MEKTPKQFGEEFEQYVERQMEEATKTGSAADKTFARACQVARLSVKNNNLLGTRNKDGDFDYTVRQGIKAACFAREDVVATLVIQQALLRKLDRNYSLLWVLLALLSYVAYRVS